MDTGKTTYSASSPLKASDYLKTERDRVRYVKEVLYDGDPRALPVAIRTLADAMGMTELARRTGLARETLYRTLNGEVSPRLDTIAALLDAFGLRLSVERKAKSGGSQQLREVNA